MELYQQILMHILEKEDIQISVPSLSCHISQIIESTCYCALQKIKAVIEDDSLEDADCFERIEKIIVIFEELGSDGGNRHDFG